MIFKYFVARLKRNWFLTLLGVFAMFLTCITFICAFATPKITQNIFSAYLAQIQGDADIMLSNDLQTSDRFFGLTEMRADEILTENAEYINGFFMSFGNVKYGDNSNDCTLYFSRYNDQQEYNPIYADIVENGIFDYSDWHCIVGKKYADTNKIKVNDRIKISFYEKEIEFTVAGIAENRGLFTIGNSVWLPSKALKRFIPILFTDIVTHAFIKAKNNNSLSIIKNQLANDYNYLKIGVPDTINEISKSLYLSMTFLCVLIIVFCMITLAIIMQIIFSRERRGYDTLRCLGLPNYKIHLTGLMNTFAMFILGALSACLVANFVGDIIMSVSPIFENVAKLVFPMVCGVLCTFVLSVVCMFICNREWKNTKHGHYKTQSKNIFTARTKTLIKSREWQKFALFLCTSIFVATVLLLVPYSIASGIKKVTADVVVQNGDATFGKVLVSFASFVQFFFADILWLLNILVYGMLALVITTSIFLIILRRISNKKQTENMIPLGITFGAEIRHNLFSLVVCLVSIFLMSFFMVFIACHASPLLFKLFNTTYGKLQFQTNVILPTFFASFFCILLIEIFMCGLNFVLANKKQK